MNSSRIVWALGVGLAYGLALLLLYAVPALRQSGDALWRLAHGLLYAALGAILLAALARQFPHAGAHVWRLGALLVGAAAAGVGLWLTQPLPLVGAAFDAWAAALLGLAIAAMLPRWLPNAIARRWLAIERRQTTRDGERQD